MRQTTQKSDSREYTPPMNVLSEKDRLRFYLRECAGTRKAYGFAMVEINGVRLLKIEDKKKLERLDPATKAILRELYQEFGVKEDEKNSNQCAEGGGGSQRDPGCFDGLEY